MRVTDEKILEMVKHCLKNHVTFEIRSRPEFNAGSEEEKYLCVVLDDEIITSIQIDPDVGTIHFRELGRL